MKLFFTLIILNVAVVTVYAQNMPVGIKVEAIASLEIKTSSVNPGQTIGFKPGAISKTTTAKPLIIVDGILYADEMEKLNPDDISSINILKCDMKFCCFCQCNDIIVITTKTAQLKKIIVKDFLSGEKIPAATICITSTNESIKALADSNGVLIAGKSKPGAKYNMTVSSAGYKTFSTTVKGKEQEILLERDVKECSNVIVSCTECPRTIRCGFTCSVTRESEVKSMNEDLSTTVYPNPVQRSKFFNIDLKNNRDETMQLAMVSLNGAMVLQRSQKINKGINHLSITADVKWAAGVYVIQLRNEKGSIVKQEKLIVQ